MRDKLNDAARLELMLEAIGNIESFTEGIASYEQFASNKILCHAVTYNLQCIGESVYKLSGEFIETHPSIDWEAIIYQTRPFTPYKNMVSLFHFVTK